MFLSGCGLYPHVDARRTSIAQAIEVAASHGMAGKIWSSPLQGGELQTYVV